MKISDITQVIEDFAPIHLQESYDNSGLLTGNNSTEVTNILISLDVTESVLDEAIEKNCQLIISHHPVVLKNGLRKFNGNNYTERIIIKAIKNNIALYAAHTNIDMVSEGVSGMMAQKLGLHKLQVLDPRKNDLIKLVTFVPETHIENVRQAIFKAGAGVIGKYDSCSFTVNGYGSFKAGDDTQPYVGKKGVIHLEKEARIETILPAFMQSKIVNALIKAHPYEEVAYDLYPLNNQWRTKGIGIVGELEKEMEEEEFLKWIKKVFNLSVIRHTCLLQKKIKRVALCGGSGSSLLNKAITQKADVFITGDFKYHQFFDAENKIIIADIGHYESEQYTKELFFELLTKKFPNFAIHLSKVNSNPIKYL
ncbi:MAG: Nif3-like dinuclear metal center hexameric protein [Marinilabiliaceae bacterium]|nr:Nif3-like dinuclear metal center hexameric protein [Marinilabiliaceae bacterium]